MNSEILTPAVFFSGMSHNLPQRKACKRVKSRNEIAKPQTAAEIQGVQYKQSKVSKLIRIISYDRNLWQLEE